MGLQVEWIFHSWNMGSIFYWHAIFSYPCVTYVLPRFNFWNLTLNPLTRKIWWAPNNASRWQKRFTSAFKGLIALSIDQMKLSWCSARACQQNRGIEPQFSTPANVKANGQFYSTVVLLCTGLIGSCVDKSGRDYEKCLSFRK